MMKNKLCYILLGILVSFSFMNTVFAEDKFNFEVYANAVGGTEVVGGSDVSVMVGVKSNTYIHACTFEVSSDNGIEYVSVNQMVDNYVALETEGIIKVVDNNTSGDAPVDGINIMKLNYKVNSSGKITIKTVECSGINEEDKGTYNNVKVDFVVKEKNEDYTLKSIKINDETVPNFYPEGNNFPVTLEKPNFSLSYETSNVEYQDKVVVKFNGIVINDLNNIMWSDPTGQTMGNLELIVNEKKTYSIVVIYEKKDLDNTLKSLKVNGKLIDLKSCDTKCSVKLKNDINSFEVEAELNDSENFKLEESFRNGKLIQSCPGSSCSFLIEIVPVNDKIGGSSRSYIIEVVKESTVPSSKPESRPTSSSKPSSSVNVNKNPDTGDISMFFMALILIASLVGSVLLYQKNMEGYK